MVPIEYGFITAEMAGKMVMESDDYRYKKYFKSFSDEIAESAIKGNTATVLIVDDDTSSKLRGKLTSLLTAAGYDCSDWNWEEGDDGSCWYRISVSWGHHVYPVE